MRTVKRVVSVFAGPTSISAGTAVTALMDGSYPSLRPR